MRFKNYFRSWCRSFRGVIFFTTTLCKRVRWQGFPRKILLNLTGILIVVILSSAKVVTVAGAPDSSSIPRSFRNDVLPVFAKVGCNSGACHGALAGKGGFKLSLRGYDPMADYVAIARQTRGRRIELSDPGRSLILAKPSGAIAHKGGLRFEVDSPEYQIIADWISQGALPPRDEDPQVVEIETLPDQVVLQPEQEQVIQVHARYSDGHVREVTRWAKFESTDDSVATVSNNGVVSVVGHGKGAVVAWYASKIAVSQITVAYSQQVNEDRWKQFQPQNFIDDLVSEQLQQLNLVPSPSADEATFLRRIYLDTIGTLPRTTEVRRYLSDQSDDKRKRLIDSLLARPEFVDYWTHKWSDLLLVDGKRLAPPAVKAYYQWIHDQVEQNTPWDQFARSVILARGSSHENGATNFYALHQDAETMTENICQAFLGLSIACAKCHNHPLERWTNDQYYAMASHFARVRAKGWATEAQKGDGLRTLYVFSQGELIQPLTGKPQPPTPLDGKPIDMASAEDRRVPLADWLVSPENPHFSRAITNRIWANFFGIGIIEPVDDLRSSNPASNEQLLSAAADYLKQQDFNLKALIRAILSSSTYATGSVTVPGNAKERRFYSHYYPRRLTAEVLLDAISQVTEVPSQFTQIEYHGADFSDTDYYPEGTRAIQLYDSAVASYFLTTFGRHPRQVTCECERSNEPSMVQVLHISNGTTIREKLSHESSVTQRLLAAELPMYRIIEDIYLACLARFPTDTEMRQLLVLAESAESEKPDEVLEDLVWSVLSSREFLFNH